MHDNFNLKKIDQDYAYHVFLAHPVYFLVFHVLYCTVMFFNVMYCIVLFLLYCIVVKI